MKKLVISLSIILVSIAATAQQADSVLRSKKGIPILPQKGDWGIGVDALPYLNYLGNIFNNTSNNTLSVGEQTVYGRYFIANNAALRLMISVNQGSSMSHYYVRDDAAYFANNLSQAQTEDSYKSKYSTIAFGIGYQKFRGYGRLKGFYGAQVGFGLSRNQYEYTYGNPITVANATPSINGNMPAYGSDNSRRLLTDNGINYRVGAGLLSGVEYYFAPKICIGGEVSLTFAHEWKTQGNSKFERLNNTIVETIEKADSPAGRTNTYVQSYQYAGYFGGNLYVVFHF